MSKKRKKGKKKITEPEVVQKAPEKKGLTRRQSLGIIGGGILVAGAAAIFGPSIF